VGGLSFQESAASVGFVDARRDGHTEGTAEQNATRFMHSERTAAQSIQGYLAEDLPGASEEAFVLLAGGTPIVHMKLRSANAIVEVQLLLDPPPPAPTDPFVAQEATMTPLALIGNELLTGLS